MCLWNKDLRRVPLREGRVMNHTSWCTHFSYSYRQAIAPQFDIPITIICDLCWQDQIEGGFLNWSEMPNKVLKYFRKLYMLPMSQGSNMPSLKCPYLSENNKARTLRQSSFWRGGTAASNAWINKGPIRAAFSSILSAQDTCYCMWNKISSPSTYNRPPSWFSRLWGQVFSSAQNWVTNKTTNDAMSWKSWLFLADRSFSSFISRCATESLIMLL